jgi:hypothetical protein
MRRRRKRRTRVESRKLGRRKRMRQESDLEEVFCEYWMPAAPRWSAIDRLALAWPLPPDIAVNN